MKQFWVLTIFIIVLAFTFNVRGGEEVVGKQVPSALINLDADIKDDGDGVRETRQFGFGRPFYGGGFYRPRPFYGGGFYRPRPFYGGGFYGPRPFYGGGFYRPRPYYGGFYGPRPFYGGGFYG